MMKLKPKKLKQTPSQQLTMVLDRLREKQIITQDQYDRLNVPLKKPITQEILIEALVKASVIKPLEPLDQSVKDFMEELGSLNSSDLVGFSQDLRLDRKGLTNMTPIPQKAFPIPGNILFLGLIGAAMFIVIVAPNWDSIAKGIHIGGVGGAPGGLGGLLGGIMPHLIFGIKSLMGVF